MLPIPDNNPLRQRVRFLVTFLAGRFPGWDLDTQETHHGLAFVAVRRDQGGQPGTCAIITRDPGELRRELGGTA